ncbi:exported protein [Lentibacillus kapialis]|uniref:Exported protein n=1 Tax=Lentibacillus kapialis TaxID=340214 RepID=A0A917PXU7_9BACI|nr:tripartite tricarboxylate transporter substrate binding protein [Lentibacillus kapialis]GGJ98372.1 exported protein [Lentibacillus kapialis]
MRKRLVLFLVSIFTFSALLVGCGKGSDSAQSDSGDKSGEGSEVNLTKRPITLVVPWSAGGITDATARILAEEAVNYLPEGAEIVVENRPGASGSIGATEIASANPDGYNLLISPLVPITEGPHFGETSYGYKDFTPITQVLSTPTVFAVNADSDIKSYEEWIKYVKDNPGEFSYGSPGAGTLDHIAMEAIALEHNLKIEHVPYKGNAPMISDLLGGHVDGGHMQIPDLIPHVKEDKVNVLWNTGSKGFPYMPEDIPTIRDKGIDLNMDAITAIVGPANLPEDIRGALNEAFKKAIESETFKEKMNKSNLAPSYAGPEKLKEIIEKRYETSGKIIEEAGLAE